MSRFSNVIKRSGAVVPFNQERIANAIYRAAVEVGGRDKELAAKLSEKVIEQLEMQCAPDCNPHIEDIQDVVEKVLIESGHAKVAKAYIIYREDAARRRAAATQRASKPSEFLPWAKLWHTLDWATEHKLNTIDNLNERIAAGEFTHIVHESEIAYEDQVNRAVEMIKEKSTTLKMVLITGPSSSGKTTTTIKLDQKLNKLGFSFVTLNIDNYFFDLALHPKDEFGDYDFETPFALDLELINEHLLRLTKGEKVTIPYYDFKTGTRHLNQTEIKLKKNEILLIDSLHGLFPDMTKAVPDEMKFKLYLEPLMQMKDSDGNYIRWADIRLIRRMLRDSVHRAYN
ncbi:MAG: response regulator SirA, partial [Ignavibacteriaceae bacterium]|nr:response regulator SirA [Ignavibacteriaceae bacterium]